MELSDSAPKTVANKSDTFFVYGCIRHIDFSKLIDNDSAEGYIKTPSDGIVHSTSISSDSFSVSHIGVTYLSYRYLKKSILNGNLTGEEVSTMIPKKPLVGRFVLSRDFSLSKLLTHASPQIMSFPDFTKVHVGCLRLSLSASIMARAIERLSVINSRGKFPNDFVVRIL